MNSTPAISMPSEIFALGYRTAAARFLRIPYPPAKPITRVIGARLIRTLPSSMLGVVSRAPTASRVEKPDAANTASLCLRHRLIFALGYRTAAARFPFSHPVSAGKTRDRPGRGSNSTCTRIMFQYIVPMIALGIGFAAGYGMREGK